MKRKFLLGLIIGLFFCLNSGFGEDDYIVAQLGDVGGDVEIVLAKCHELGFMKELAEGKNIMEEADIPSIMKMEESLGLTADGIIRLSEFMEFESSLHVGSSGEEVQDLLERLFDLGYIREKLPEPHDVYKKKYENAVKNIEKKLDLHADGILLRSELEQIKKEPLAPLEEPAKISSKYRNGVVELSWSSVKGALSYKIYRGGQEIAQIDGKTTWSDSDVEMRKTYKYTVKAESYLRQTTSTSVETIITVPFVKNITFRDRNNKLGQTIRNGSLIGQETKVPFSARSELKQGKVKVDSFTQQQIRGDCTRFTIIFTAPKGYEISVFNPPHGNKLMFNSIGTTSGYKEAIQFDISNSVLSSINYEITVNIVKSDNNRYFLFPDIKHN